MERVDTFASVVGLEKPERFSSEVRTKLEVESADIIDVDISDSNGGRVQCIIGRKDEVIYRYSIMGSKDAFSEPGMEGKTSKDAISEGDAFKAVENILEFYGLPQEQEEYSLFFFDVGNVKSENDLAGGTWTVRYHYKYNNISCRQMGIAIALSPLSGRILLIQFKPRIIPIKPREIISKEVAATLATEWLMKLRLFSSKNPTPNVDEIIEIIAPEEKDFDLIKSAIKKFNGKTISKYCWEVPFVYTEHGKNFSINIWVDMENGAIIGGGGY